MKIFKIAVTFLLGGFMVFGGINHFLNPIFYDPFIPDFFPKQLANYGAGIIEIILGLALMLKKYRYYASIGLIILLLLFLPIHIWDLLKASPAIGSKTVASIRIPIQFLLILWAWWVRGDKPT